ncbi:MAG: peptide chain release factor N(5)-glutamine methyltransferase [Termitinemataceae bacterium]|nr:MAG: peptide chain release factor N(5)-glutamine methyltransferase [Termitinemataceae bacterium]
MTFKAALTYAKKILKDSGIDSFSIDAVVLLCDVLKISREKLFTHIDQDLSETQYQTYRSYLKKRLNGICTACILGHKEFRYLDIIVSPDVLVPRPDTELLVETALSYIDEKLSNSKAKIKILDLCCGSGAVAVSLLYERSGIQVIASDISDSAIIITKQNSEKYNLPLQIITSDLFDKLHDKLPMEGKFDLIVSNPPYIKTSVIKTLSREVQNEPHIALDGGEDGLELIRRIISESNNFLKIGGALIMEAEMSIMKQIEQLLYENKYTKIKIIKDLSGSDRVISALMSF